MCSYVLAPLLGVTLLCLTNNCQGQDHRDAQFIVVPVATVGDSFRSQLKDADSPLAAIFAHVSPEVKNALCDELGKMAAVQVIEKCSIGDDGAIQFDSHWSPKVAVVGKTAAVLSATDLKLDTPYVCVVQVRVPDARVMEDGSRFLLVNFDLELVGTAMELIHADIRGVSLSWQLSKRITTKTAAELMRPSEGGATQSRQVDSKPAS